jgi:hypothetical protein
MTYEPPAWSPPGPAPESPASPAAGEPPLAVPAQPGPAYAAPAYPPPYDASGYAAGYGTAGYGTAGYGGGYAYPVAAPKRTNPMAIASMTTSIVGLPLLMCYGLGLPVSIVGAILGHIAKRQIRERDEQGEGMALAGIIMGWIGTGLAVLGVGALIVFIAAFARTGSPA